jgi:L-malate glycosyltransferase
MKVEVSNSVSQPLRVMHVLLTMGVGGAEKLVYDMISHQDSAMLNSSVCCLQAMGPLGDKLRESGVPVFFYERKHGIDWSMIGWLRKLIISEKIDVLHAHQYTPMFYTVLAAVGLSRVRIIYTEHGRLYPEKWSWKRYLFNPLLSLGIDHIVSIAESTKQAMVRYDNFPVAKTRVIHNGVDFETFNTVIDVSAKRRELGLTDTDRIIGTAARLEEIKNLPMMLRAFKQVLAVQPDTVLLIAGRGSQEEPLKKLAAELGLSDRVKFLGLRFDLPEIYPLFEVFLLSSFTEGISITLLEAMANGVPVVVTDVGGNPEVVVDGETGCLVPSDDDIKMSVKILELLKTRGMAQRMGRSAVERVESLFSFRIMMDNYKCLYEQ